MQRGRRAVVLGAGALLAIEVLRLWQIQLVDHSTHWTVIEVAIHALRVFGGIVVLRILWELVGRLEGIARAVYDDRR